MTRLNSEACNGTIIILPHLMSKKGILSSEGKARSHIALNNFKAMNYCFLLTSGWAYRMDSEISLSQAHRNFIANKFGNLEMSIIENHLSRDTVGDALFARYLYSDKIGVNRLMVVTSDYHVNRAKKIFSDIFFDVKSLEIVGVPSNPKSMDRLNLCEEQSLNAYKKTFIGCNFRNLQELITRLLSHHPYYNGKIYTRLQLE